MQVSWSPMARETRVAATVESTPPETAQMARFDPTCARMPRMASLMKLAGFQAPLRPQIPKRKLARMAGPCGV